MAAVQAREIRIAEASIEQEHQRFLSSLTEEDHQSILRELEQAEKEAADPNTKWYTHEEVHAEILARRKPNPVEVTTIEEVYRRLEAGLEDIENDRCEPFEDTMRDLRKMVATHEI